MKFTAVFALAMASVAMAAPADFAVVDVAKRTDHGGSQPPSGGSGGSPCSDNRVQVNIQEVQGLLGIISGLGNIITQNGGGAFCCDAGAPQFGLINLSALNCVKIL
ncbi:hypothetical protein LIA77_00577 [Sarocladium implicatum]|nr:hypothetical protein LIA77_00577 [Sarocladium implicatum]